MQTQDYLAPLMKAVENHCYNVYSTDALLDLFAGGAAISAGAADCIKTIHMNDLGSIAYAYPALQDIKYLYVTLGEAAKIVVYKLSDASSIDMLYGEWHMLNLDNIPRYKIAALFEDLKVDAYNGFHKYPALRRDGIDGFSYDMTEADMSFVIDRNFAAVTPGLALILTYGSVNTAGKNVNYDRFIEFLKGIKDMEMFVESLCSKSVGFEEALRRFFFTKEFEKTYGRKPINKQRLCKLFSTAAGLIAKDVTCSNEEAIESLLLYKTHCDGSDSNSSDSSQRRHFLVVADPPYPSEEGNKYTEDAFNFVDATVMLMQTLNMVNAPYIVFCDENSIEVYEPAIHAKGLNVYSINPRRKNDGVVEYIITNIDLPAGPYSTLPEDFQAIAKANYEKALKNGMVFSDEYIDSDEDFDRLGRAYLPLHKVENLPVDEEYRRQWAEIESTLCQNRD